MTTVLERTSSLQLATLLNTEKEFTQEKQAFAIVQTLVRVSVARFAYLRHLFPEHCFTFRDPSYIRQDSDLLYDRVNGHTDTASSHESEADLTRPGDALEVLARGQSAGADRLLDWLEAIFDGVLEHSLEGVQFSIYVDRTRPTHILESYTFSFQYGEGSNGSNRRLAGLTAPDGTSVSLVGARSELMKILDQLHRYSEVLPNLPRERYLMCHLFYPSDRSQHQQPSGFRACADTAILFPEEAEWHLAKRNFGAINTGFYRYLVPALLRSGQADERSTGLRIAFMAQTKDAGQSLGEDFYIPEKITDTRVLLRDFDLQRHSASPMSRSILQLLKQSTQAIQRDPSDAESPARGLAQGPGNVPTGNTKSTRQKRPFEDLELRKTNGFSEDELIATQVLEPQGAPVDPMQRARLLRGKSLDMRVKRCELEQNHQCFVDAPITRCECGFNRKEGPSMLQCGCCGTLQHLHCYGFILEKPGDNHYCYQCLLEDLESERLAEMKELAHFRRALWVLYDWGEYDSAAYTAKSLAGKLDVNNKIAAQLIKRMKAEGFLTHTRNPELVKTAAQIATRHRVYGDPFTSIGFHYEIPEEAAIPKIQTEDVKSWRKRVRIRKA